MPIPKSKKEEMIKDLQRSFEQAEIAVFLNFHGLSAKENTAVRRELLAHDARYQVAKKTFVYKAFERMGKSMAAREGEMAVVFGNDVLGTTKIVAKITKARETLRLLGGWWQKKFIDAAELKTLAAIPGREVLLAQLCFLLGAPMSGFVRILHGLSRRLTETPEAGRVQK